VELVAKGASKHPPRLTSNPSITPRVRGYHQDYSARPEARDHYRRANSNNCYASYHAKVGCDLLQRFAKAALAAALWHPAGFLLPKLGDALKASLFS